MARLANLDSDAGGVPAAASRLAAYAAESNPVEGFQNGVLMLAAAAWHVAGAGYRWNTAAGELGFPAADGSVRLLSSEDDRGLPP